MTILLNGFLDLAAAETRGPAACRGRAPDARGTGLHRLAARPAERRNTCATVAWEIGERRAGRRVSPRHDDHVGLATVAPGQGFAHWRIPHGWVEQTRPGQGRRLAPLPAGAAPLRCLLHPVQRPQRPPHPGPHPARRCAAQLFFQLPRPGTWQLAEVGFLLRSGEFIPAARSPAVPFPGEAPSSPRRPRRPAGGRPRPRRGGRQPLGPGTHPAASAASRGCAGRCASPLSPSPSLALRPGRHAGPLRLRTGRRAGRPGHEVHVFVPASAALPADREEAGVHYHAARRDARTARPLERARGFGRAAAEPPGRPAAVRPAAPARVDDRPRPAAATARRCCRSAPSRRRAATAPRPRRCRWRSRRPSATRRGRRPAS